MKDGHLFLSLMADGGIYEFEPVAGPSAGLQKSPVASKGPIHYVCAETGGGSSPITATFYQTEPSLVLVERESQTRPAFRVPAASGDKYQGTDVMFWEPKGEALVTWSGIEFKCKPFSNGNVSAASLFDKKWQLIDMNGVAVQTGKPYLEFDGQTNRFSGDGGCNTIAGAFKIDGPHIQFSQGISTQRACIDHDVEKLETDFFRGLNEVTSFQVQRERLQLYKGNQLFLTFGAEEAGAGGSRQDALVTGTVYYRQRIALTPNAVIEVKLLDVSRAGAAAVTIAEQTIKPAGRQVPIAFEIRYDPSRIDVRNSYVIQARILEGGQLRFINTQAHPVITQGHPKAVDVMVEQAVNENVSFNQATRPTAAAYGRDTSSTRISSRP